MRTTLRLAAILAIACASAQAMATDLVVRQGNDEVRLAQDAPCTHPGILAVIPKEVQEQFRAATGNIQGRTFAGCWIQTPGAARILWEDGEQGMVPLRMLRPVRHT